MANHWNANGHKVSIVCLSNELDTPFYPLTPDIKLMGLDLNRQSNGVVDAIMNNVHRISKIRQAIKKTAPNAVISFMDTTNVTAILATRCMNVPVIVSERLYPGNSEIGRVWKILRNMTYPLASAIVTQTKSGKHFFGKTIRSKACVIANPLTEMNGSSNRPSDLPSPTLLAVGRLVYQKGYDILLRAFAATRHHHQDWRLVILGKGPLKKQLEAMRDNLGLTDAVSFLGTRKDIKAYYQHADALVLSSRYEGFPNVLLEGLAHGLPVVATDCLSGPKEILDQHKGGILVPCEDDTALAQALNTLMEDTQLRREFAQQGPGVKKTYSIANIMAQWDKLLTNLIEEKR